MWDKEACGGMRWIVACGVGQVVWESEDTESQK